MKRIATPYDILAIVCILSATLLVSLDKDLAFAGSLVALAGIIVGRGRSAS